MLSAPVGESHTAMAAALARSLKVRPEVGKDVGVDPACSRGERPGLKVRPEVDDVVVLDDLRVLGPALGKFLASGFELHLGRVQWSYDIAYRLFAKNSAGRRMGEWALYRLGARSLERTIAAHRPDVVVSTYPVFNPVLSRLRASGRLRCPAAAVVEPLGGLYFWVQPHLDLHLLHYPESLPEVARLGGARSACAVRPLVREEFLGERLGRASMREHLGVAHERRLVLVSGGGWGAGDIAGAVRACSGLADVEAIAVAGRNERLRAALRRTFAATPNVRVLGFSQRMHELLSAADALVTTTAGLSAIEARLCGCPVVCYGFAVGHVRDNTRALREAGLARTAATQPKLREQVAAALAAGRDAGSAETLAVLPDAADVLLSLAGSKVGRSWAADAQPLSSAAGG